MTDRAKHNGTTMEQVNAAFKQVAIRVVKVAKQTGTPVIIWEDGQIKRIPAEEFTDSGKRIVKS
ncbi:MAG: hypothetical protein SGJ20_13595 [Planctomycetota bacterium]|nr:hypothetical protein [Planctomycetota bacterium]